MSMNREQKRAAQKAGQINADGSQATNKDRRVPAQRLKSERTSPVEFVREVRAELRKVAWPTREEVIRYSAIVLAALIIFTTFVFAIDYVFGELFRVLLDPGTKAALTGAVHPAPDTFEY